MENSMQNPPKSGPKDVFYHLLAITTLYASAVSFIALMFALINEWFPDPLAYGAGEAAIRWGASVLIVMFPVHVLMRRLIAKDVQAVPAKRELRVAKWLGYLTLFVSALTVIIDIITLVYQFLGGETSVRFYLKVGVVLLVAGFIFLYYYQDTRHDKAAAVDGGAV